MKVMLPLLESKKMGDPIIDPSEDIGKMAIERENDITPVFTVKVKACIVKTRRLRTEGNFPIPNALYFFYVLLSKTHDKFIRRKTF